MRYVKKGLFLIVSTAMMVVLLLAAGGVHILPAYVLEPVMAGELWSAVGGLFSMMLLPGVVVGYATCHSRILGVLAYTVFVVCGIISGANLWWVTTAVLLVLSYIYCTRYRVGGYDKLCAYDKISVLVPAFGLIHMADRYRLTKLFNILGKIFAVCAMVGAVVLPLFQAFVEQNMGGATLIGGEMKHNALIVGMADFGSTLFGVMLYHVFFPLCAVLCAKYLFVCPKLVKIVAFVIGGYNAYRGFFIFMPILFSVGNLGATAQVEGVNPIFNNMFGIEACFLMAMLLGGILCIRIAVGKKRTFAAAVCMSDDGCVALKCLFMAALESALVFIIAPAIIYIAWAILMLIFFLLSAVFINMVPEGGSGIDWPYYNFLLGQGMSENEAFNMARMKAMREKQ